MAKIISKNHYVFFIYLALALICYGVVLNAPMLFDDEHFIQHNKYVHELNVSKIYTSSVTGGAGLSCNFYRPNQQMVFALLYQFSGENSLPYHILQILLHLCNAFLIFIILLQLHFLRTAAFLSAAIFLIHPVQTQAVSYISGMADPLGLFFLLWALYSFLQSYRAQKSIKKQTLWFALATFCFLLALFTKENMVVFFPIIIIVSMWLYAKEKRPSFQPFIKYIALFGVMALGYFILKMTAFNFTEYRGLTGEENIYNQNLHIRLVTFLSVLIEYLRLVFLPLDLHYEKPYVAYVQFLNEKSWFGILLSALMLFLLVKFKKYPNSFLGLGIFFAGLLPFTGILPLNAMFLEHWLYIPMLGVVVLLCSLVSFLIKKKIAGYFIFPFILVVIMLTYRTYARNVQWSSPEKFYLNEIKYTQSSVRIFNNLGMYYAENNLPYKAIEFYSKAAAVDNRFPHPHHNIGNLYMDMGQIDEAIYAFYRALEINPNFTTSLSNLYHIYMHLGREDKAAQIEKLIENAQQGMPNDFYTIHHIITAP